MAETIKVFISSKNKAPFNEPGDKTLTELRREIKERLEAEKLLGDQLFEVWINEDAPAPGAVETATAHCLEQVRKANVVLVLYSGDAGWESSKGALGICHAEFQEALNFAPASLRIMELPETGDLTKPANKAFDDEIKRRRHFRAAVNKPDEAVARSVETVVAAVRELVGAGAKAQRGAAYYSGAPLDWARLGFEARSKRMTEALVSALEEQAVGREDPRRLHLKLGKRKILAVCHAIPAALSVAAARERVGQPFLSDYLQESVTKRKLVGPIHLVACHQGVTEAQALRQLGFPDAMIITAPFGVYVADDVQRIQMVFLKDCRDEGNTRVRTEQLMRWLQDEGEEERLAERAIRRAEIVKAMAA
jgi:hypothetical protein